MRNKIVNIIKISGSILFYLLLFIPMLYTKYNDTIKVINGYKALSFLGDNSNKALYFGTLSLIILMICYVFNLIFGIVSFFSKEEMQKRVSIMAYLMNLIAICFSVILVITYSMCYEANIHINIGAYVVLIYTCLFSLSILLLTYFKDKKKN